MEGKTQSISNKTKIIIALVVVVVAALGIGLWQIIKRSDTSDKTVTIVIQYENGSDKVYNCHTNKAVLVDLINEKSQLKAVIGMGFISEIGGLKPDASKNEFIAMFTSLENYSDSTWGSVVYKSLEYYSATVGIDDLPLVDGQIIIFCIQRW